MIEKIRKSIKGLDRFYLIGVYSVEENIAYKLLEVSLEVDNLKIINKQAFLSFNDDFKAHLKKDFPVILHFDGDNVISRATKNEQGYRNNIVFKMNPDDFYFYEYHQENQIFASLTRKQIIDDTIIQLNTIEKFVVHLSIGPFVLPQIFQMVKGETQLFSFSHCLKLNSGQIESFEKTETKLTEIVISDEKFSQDEIGLIATFLEYKQGNEKIKFEDDFLSKNKDEQLYRKRFKLMSAFTIIFIMLILFIGHQLLNSYINSLAEKESEYSLSQQTVMKVNELREERLLKEKILEASGVIDANYMSQFIVDIGNITPETITINMIHINPPLKKIKVQEKINIDIKTIQVIGESNNDGDFNTFIKDLNRVSWIKKVDILDYSEDKSVNSFLIKVTK
ncbi:hypothetical protein [Psychroserpens mesophilus]|uniref:hypothetical protein n=1 Tax=Psychroserpens mesophilus TaxID=325473 RepID=UPI00058CEE7D|nr:hypothetical protein [Psychroserpens mesophilus]